MDRRKLFTAIGAAGVAAAIPKSVVKEPPKCPECAGTGLVAVESYPIGTAFFMHDEMDIVPHGVIVPGPCPRGCKSESKPKETESAG